jgi:hypothetical protein
MTDWLGITTRNARSVQTTIGWIYWDPGAVRRYEELGIPHPLGYIASRSVPLAATGAEAVTAAFGSISPIGIAVALDLVRRHTTPEAVWAARDAAVAEGLAEHAPGIIEPLRRIGPRLWPVVERLPTVGRVFFAAHLRMPRSDDALLSGWHAVNCLREWRGDTHWAVVAANGLTGVEASVLHNVWLGYEEDWLPNSRGSSADDIAAAKQALHQRGLLGDEGIRLRNHIEHETDRLTTLPWELLGEDESIRFAEEFEPPCELLLRRVDLTAGPNYQPASRVR